MKKILIYTWLIFMFSGGTFLWIYGHDKVGLIIGVVTGAIILYRIDLVYKSKTNKDK